VNTQKIYSEYEEMEMDIRIESSAKEYIAAKAEGKSVTLEVVERPGGT
jgi:hypothetical protein